MGEYTGRRGEKKKTDTKKNPTKAKGKRDVGSINIMHKILNKEESEKWRERKVTF